MRVLLDTNVLVAAFATRGLCADLFRTAIADHVLLVGSINLEELQRVLGGKLRMQPGRVQEVTGLVQRHADVIAPFHAAGWPESDRHDRWVVAAALAGRADVLVTGDKDLIEAAGGRELAVMSPRDLWESLHDGDH